jgi:hypothetical protein
VLFLYVDRRVKHIDLDGLLNERESLIALEQGCHLLSEKVQTNLLRCLIVHALVIEQEHHLSLGHQVGLQPLVKEKLLDFKTLLRLAHLERGLGLSKGQTLGQLLVSRC